MVKKQDIYKCEKCGNVIEIALAGTCIPFCCGEEMKKQDEKTADKTTEKHVPLVEKTAKGYKVTVGSTLHPMTEEHRIVWIELLAGPFALRKYLKAGEQPVAEFETAETQVSAREYCNIHGLWRS